MLRQPYICVLLFDRDNKEKRKKMVVDGVYNIELSSH